MAGSPLNWLGQYGFMPQSFGYTPTDVSSLLGPGAPAFPNPSGALGFANVPGTLNAMPGMTPGSFASYGATQPLPSVPSFGFNPAAFGPSQALLGNLQDVAQSTARQPFMPDIGPVGEAMSAYNDATSAPMAVGGGQILNPRSVATGATLGAPAAAAATGQQASLYGQRQGALSDFMLNAANSRNQIAQMVQQLALQQTQAQNQALQEQFGLAKQQQGLMGDVQGLVGSEQGLAQNQIDLIKQQAAIDAARRSLLANLGLGDFAGSLGSFLGNVGGGLLKGFL